MQSSVNHQESIIKIHDVSFAYGDHVVLDRVHLSVHRGDYLALVGGNGSGKTTLIKVMLGLVPPRTGSVTLFGVDIQAFTQWEKIGYVPQKVTSFDQRFPATVYEVVLMGRYGPGLFARRTIEDKNKTTQALKQVGMWEHKDRLIGDLSGGQQQRVFIARALAGGPEVLILDEPTVGVEKEVKDTFYLLLQELNRSGLTIVLVTHDIETVAHEAMHVACIDRTIFFHDSVDAYFAQSHTPTKPHTHI